MKNLISLMSVVFAFSMSLSPVAHAASHSGGAGGKLFQAGSERCEQIIFYREHGLILRLVRSASL